MRVQARLSTRKEDNQGIDVVMTISIQGNVTKKKRTLYVQVKPPRFKLGEFLKKHGARFKNIFLLQAPDKGIRQISIGERIGQGPNPSPNTYKNENLIIVIVNSKDSENVVQEKIFCLLTWAVKYFQ